VRRSIGRVKANHADTALKGNATHANDKESAAFLAALFGSTDAKKSSHFFQRYSLQIDGLRFTRNHAITKGVNPA
jgi:hypothetical protein